MLYDIVYFVSHDCTSWRVDECIPGSSFGASCVRASAALLCSTSSGKKSMIDFLIDHDEGTLWIVVIMDPGEGILYLSHLGVK